MSTTTLSERLFPSAVPVATALVGATSLFVLSTLVSSTAAVGAGRTDGASLLLAAVTALLFGLGFEGWRRQGWSIGLGVALLLAIAARPSVLYLVTVASESSPIVLALVALVVVARKMETARDVQAQISFGIVLALMAIAAPFLALLALPLAIVAALTDRDARSSLRVFLSLFFVLITPTLIVAIGRALFAWRTGMPTPGLFGDLGAAGPLPPPLLGSFSILPLLPVALVPLVALLRSDRRAHFASALLVLALPCYLEAGRSFWNFAMPSFVPGLVLVAGVAALLACTRISGRAKWIAILAFFVSALLAWQEPRSFGDAAWIAGLLQPLHAVAATLP